MIGSPEPYQPAIRPWMRATSVGEAPAAAAFGVAPRTMSRLAGGRPGSRPGPRAASSRRGRRPGRSGKTGRRRGDAPRCRWRGSWGVEKPQVRAGEAVLGLERSFHPVWGSAKPERTHRWTSSRLMWAVGDPAVVRPVLGDAGLAGNARGPMSKYREGGRGGVWRGGRGRGHGLAWSLGPPGGSGTWPVPSAEGGRGQAGADPDPGTDPGSQLRSRGHTVLCLLRSRSRDLMGSHRVRGRTG